MSLFPLCHATTRYQFLPVIGRLVADAILGELPEDLVKKFALDRQHRSNSDEVNLELILRIERRIDSTRKLDESSLSTSEDLLPTQQAH